jgi:putative hydrolase of HD superfamily
MTHEESRASRFEKQLEFVRAVDKLKLIGRQTLLMDGSRYENDAEHSWHLSLMALILSEYANEAIDILKVLTMVVVHDLVEIHAGDTFCYDVEKNRDKAEREKVAAEKVFGLLPDDQGESLKRVWQEFEARESPESRFAAALDRLQPLMHNYATDGAAWKKHGVKRSMVEERNAHIRDGSEKLWEEFRNIVESATEKGFLQQD